ncbi:MAG: DivIVA domain-containing protein [Malacoplasma sp.]|nr:DivIVA domain-containing protein [Malacoplasma sp.]MDE7075513.1 DivIVA domain-containing protein [Malacoplasma sp.]MDE7088122.1 DivIVA domain-containing protein [Malacoplasma sp.]
MKENTKKIFDAILDRKFSKNMSAGYDPLEVDIFLDGVRNFLIKLDKNQRFLEDVIDQKMVEITELKEIISQKNSIIKSLNADIESLKQDGYQSQKLMNDVGKLQVAVNELQNNKNKK